MIHTVRGIDTRCVRRNEPGTIPTETSLGPEKPPAGDPARYASNCCSALAVVTVVLVAAGVVSVLSLSGYVTAMNDAELVEPCTR